MGSFKDLLDSVGRGELSEEEAQTAVADERRTVQLATCFGCGFVAFAHNFPVTAEVQFEGWPDMWSPKRFCSKGCADRLAARGWAMRNVQEVGHGC